MKTKQKKEEKQFEKEIEKEVEEKAENWVKKKISPKAETGGEIISIICTFVLLWAAHNVLSWDYKIFDFVLDDFSKIIWAIDIALGVNIFTKTIKLFFPNRIVKSIMLILDSLVSIILFIEIIKVFPYDFKKLINIGWINGFVKVMVWTGLLGTVAAIITEIVKLIKSSVNENPEYNKN